MSVLAWVALIAAGWTALAAALAPVVGRLLRRRAAALPHPHDRHTHHGGSAIRDPHAIPDPDRRSA